MNESWIELAPGFSAAIVYVTPQIAEKWLAKNHPDNRNIDWKRVAAMASDMRSGNWVITHQGVAFDADGMLIDGQHRLHAIAKADVGASVLVVRNQATSMRSPIDVGARRTIGFIVGRSFKEVSCLNVLRQLEQGGPAYETLTVAECSAVGERHAAVMAELTDVIPSSMSGGVRAAIVWAYPCNKSAVREFATKVTHGEMIGRGDPPYALRNWLERNKQGRAWQVCMAALGSLALYLAGESQANVYVAEAGYRAVTTRRRALKIQNTPSADLVPSVSRGLAAE